MTILQRLKVKRLQKSAETKLAQQKSRMQQILSGQNTNKENQSGTVEESLQIHWLTKIRIIFKSKKFIGILISLVLIGILISVTLYYHFLPKIIFVKYTQGPVSLANFTYLDTSKSTFINEAWYKSSDQYLILALDNTYYHYCKVPENIWLAFSKSNSFGDFYNSNIKSNYQCEANLFYPGDICIKNAIDESNKYLQSKGFHEISNGSWQDKNGDFPNAEVGNSNEEYMNSIYSKCLEANQ